MYILYRKKCDLRKEILVIPMCLTYHILNFRHLYLKYQLYPMLLFSAYFLCVILHVTY